MKDLPFILGNDQMIILGKALESPHEVIRLAAAKLLSRKKTPEAREMMASLAADASELVRTFAGKALTLMK
jgi:HEAT repeat protein